MKENLIDAAEKERALDFARLARRDLGQIKGSSALDWACQSLTIVLAKTGDLLGAKTFADGIADVGTRISALTIIVENQAEQGDPVGAREILSVARGLVERLPREKAWWSSGIGMAQVKLGDIAGALATVEGIDAPWARVGMLVTIANGQWRAGDSKGAMANYSAARDALAGEIEQAADYHLNKIIESEVWTGNYDWACEAIGRIKNRIQQAQGYLTIGNAQANAGKKTEALATLTQARETLHWVAAEQWEKRRSVRVLTGIERSLRDLSDYLAADDVLHEAMTIATSIVSCNDAKVAMLVDVALAQRAADAGSDWGGTLQMALQATGGIEKPEDRVACLWRVACNGATECALALARDVVEKALKEKVSGSDPFEVGLVARSMAWEGVKADLSWIDRLQTAEEEALANSGSAVGIIGF